MTKRDLPYWAQPEYTANSLPCVRPLNGVSQLDPKATHRVAWRTSLTSKVFIADYRSEADASAHLARHILTEVTLAGIIWG